MSAAMGFGLVAFVVYVPADFGVRFWGQSKNKLAYILAMTPNLSGERGNRLCSAKRQVNEISENSV